MLPHQASLPSRLFQLRILLRLRLHFLQLLALLFTLELIRSPDGNVFRLVVAEQRLEPFFDDPAASIVDNHNSGDHHLEVRRERNETQLLVNFGNKFRGAGESDAGDTDKAPVHTAVFADGLAERTALVVDGERGDLLDELKQIDCRIEKGWLEFLFEIGVRNLGLSALDVLRDVDEGRDVNSELTKDRTNDVDVKDVVLRTFLTQGFDGLRRVSINAKTQLW